MQTRELTKQLAALLSREHAALADFLVALAGFDRERRWLELGYTSLFWFLHRELGLSKGAAFYRKAAAELVQGYPEVIEPLRDGRLCLTSVAELAKVITPENRRDVVARFFHASKQEAKAIRAELRPAESAPRREVVTALALAPAREPAQPVAPPAPRVALGTACAPGEGFPDEPHPERTTPGTALPTTPPPPARPGPPRDQAEPLTADLRRLHVTVSRRFLEKLAAAREALSHTHPVGGTEAVLEAALDLLLAERDRKRALVQKPRPSPARPSTRPRHVPADVKRTVWKRDDGCCQWPVASGGICGSRTRLQLDHIVPVALGGTSTVSNMRVLCALHNALAARQVYGGLFMDQFTARAARASVRGDASAESLFPARPSE
jgi:HNH endonuclease